MQFGSERFDPSEQESSAGASFDIIIVGTGLAGYTLAREVRKIGKVATILLLTRDDGAYYSKPLLSNGLAKNKSAEDLAAQSAQAMSNNLHATIITHAEVSSIDALNGMLSAVGVDYRYGKLVIATGAQQIKLPIGGNAADQVLSVNDLGDYAAFRQRLKGVSRVAVMGPGLIGCEFANDLASAGKVTCIIGPDKAPLERLLPLEIGEALQAALTSLGVEWYLENFVERAEYNDQEHANPEADQFLLTLKDGSTLEAGLVVSAAGLKPDLTLGKLANLECAEGIVVDRHLQTSDKNIFAIGDCAEVAGRVLPYVAPIMHAAKALAHNLFQDIPAMSSTVDDASVMIKVAYPAMPVVIKTPVYPLVVASPMAQGEGSWEVEAVEGGLRALFRSPEGELFGFVLGGSAISEKAKLGRQLPPLLA